MSRPLRQIEVQEVDGLVTVTLARPEAGNALDRAMAEDLVTVTTMLATSSTARAVLLRGAGRNFCVGGDIKGFSAAQDEGTLDAYILELVGLFHMAVAGLVHLDMPVVAAVQGSVAGGGLSLACSCDLVVAGEGTRFVVAYAGIGLTPDGSASSVLPRLIGLRRALELTLTNRPLSAREAVDWGLISHVVPDGELDKRARALAEELARGPTRALGASKRLLRAGWTEGIDGQLRDEGATITAMAGTADAKEGIAAFIEKRPPTFTGH